MEDNQRIIFLGCIFIIFLWLGIIFTLTTKKDVKLEKTTSINEIPDRVVKCDVPLITTDAVVLECNINYLHNESRPEMLTSTVNLIDSYLNREIGLLAKEYCKSDFINKREEIVNRIMAIPQKFKNQIPSNFSWEILNIVIKVPKDTLS